MSTKVKYADETVREAQHAKLDEVYSKRSASVPDAEIASVEEPDGNRKSPHHITLEGQTLKATGTVVLDREGWLALSKHARRRAQAV